MNILKKLSCLLFLCLLAKHLSAQAGVATGCSDSSFHIKHYSLNNPFEVSRQIAARNGGRIIIGQMGGTGNSTVMIAKVNKWQNVEWSKNISVPPGYNSLKLFAVTETPNENIAVSGVITENITNSHFYYAVFSASGNLLKQEVPRFPVPNNSYKGVHTICQQSADSLLFLFYSGTFISGREGLCMLSCNNDGNAGTARILGIPINESQIAFSAAVVSGNILNMYGSGYSALSCNTLNQSGTLTSVQYDLAGSQIIYHKTYCVPFTNTPANYPPPPVNQLNSLSQRIFFLRNGNIAMVRTYQGVTASAPYLAIPMYIAYFDRSFTLMRSEYIQSRALFQKTTIQDIYIDSNGTKHISFSDFNNRNVYYAIADSNNQLLLQKKLPIPDFQYGLADNHLQLIESGMFTGFTTQNTTGNTTYLHYVQLRNEDASNACFGTDTSFLSFIPVPVSPNNTAPAITSTPASMVPISINCPVTDLQLLREDVCMVKNICDTLALHAPDTVCSVSNPVTITVYKNQFCKGPVLFYFDTAAVAGYAQTSDTTLLLTFSKSWKGKVIAQAAACPTLHDSIELVVSAPTLSFGIGDDTIYCPGKTYILEAPSGFREYEWQNGSTNNQFIAFTHGKYYVTATDFCNRVFSDTLVIKPLGTPLSAGPDTTICELETIELNATAGFSNYSWSPFYNISNTEGRQVSVFPGGTTTYIVKAEKFTGCILTDSVIVATKVCPQKFFIANAFSPNGDGHNDTFKPVITGVLKQYEFLVYNRWGQQIFRTANRNEGWNGFIDGRYQNNNIYIWVCKYQFINQPQQIKKGTVNLIR